MKIEIDKNAGFCFGVKYAIKKAETDLKNGKQIFCLGEIVHNQEEINRLHKIGMQTITIDELDTMKNKNVLFRAHGEPPETYQNALKAGVKIIDATCPIVLKLQKKVYDAYNEMKQKDGQIVIFGKKGHAEVIGLNGQTDYNAIIISSSEDLDKIDFSKPVRLFSQTTMPVDKYREISKIVYEKMVSKQHPDKVDFQYLDSVCTQVGNRDKYLEKFATNHDVIIFVSGKNSSNGKSLYLKAKSVNDNTFFISKPQEIDFGWFDNAKSVGISSATSTPQWLIEEVKSYIEQKIDNKKIKK